MALSKSTSRHRSPGPTYGPLVTLSHLLRGAGPPALSHLLALFGQAEEYGEFTRLVREFLPDLELEILGQGALDGASAFAEAFGARYFPLGHLEPGFMESLEDLTRWVPVHVQGLAWDDYHDLPNWRPGFVLASLLVDFDWELDLVESAETPGGIRITLLEEAARQVPRGPGPHSPGGIPQGFPGRGPGRHSLPGNHRPRPVPLPRHRLVVPGPGL